MMRTPPFGFAHEVRVPYAHVDQMGVVYYAHYLVYFEMARAALLRENGMPYAEMEKKGVLLPVLASHCEHKLPARFDELLTVIIAGLDLRGARIHIDYEIRRGDDLLVTGYTDHVCMSPDGRALKPAPELRDLARGFEQSRDRKGLKAGGQ